jgi:hypothetical protein
MSRDNNTNFDSWDTKGYNRDTRHAPDGTDSWDGEFESLNSEWNTHQTLNRLQQMLDSRDPEQVRLARHIISQRSGAAAALKGHNDRRVEQLTKAAGPKSKKGWDAQSINKAVRDVLNSK